MDWNAGGSKRVVVEYGRQRRELEMSHLIQPPRPVPPALADPAVALTRAVEQPLGFPALRKALIPDDQVVILVDERLPHLPELLTALLDHVLSAGVEPSAVTLLCPVSGKQHWLEQLPERLEDVRLEVHDPHTRDKLSYVAATHEGQPLYFNRSAVDAGQLVILSARRFEPLLGYGGAEGALYPAFTDEATRSRVAGDLSPNPPGEKPWRHRAMATEAVWLMGAPFFVQVIEAGGDGIAEVLAGTQEACEESLRRLDAHWRYRLPQAAQTVVATVSGDPARHTFADLADAALCASRVVARRGRIVLLTDAAPELGPAVDLLRGAEEPADALMKLAQSRDFEAREVWQWASAAEQAQLYLLSALPEEVVEGLFAVPLKGFEEAQRLVAAAESSVVLNDAHKSLALVE